MQTAKEIFDPGMPGIEYTEASVQTVAGIAKAERLVEQGWKIYRSTPFMLYLKRKVR